MVKDGDAFRAWIAPYITAARKSCDAIEAITERHGELPDATSEAMGELAAQRDYQGKSYWENPVSDTHTFGAMTLRAAIDYLRSYVQLFDADQPPVYGYAVLARAGFESSTVSAWLNEPGIGVLERIRRGLSEQLYSAREVDALGISDESRDRLDGWIATAQAFGWTAKASSSKVDGMGRPSVSEGIRKAAGSNEGSRIGDLLYCRTAAISHVTWFGLQSGLDIQRAEVDPNSRTGRVAFGTDGSRVGPILFYLHRSVRYAASARIDLMGWSDGAWNRDVERQFAFENDLGRDALSQLSGAAE